MTKDLIQDQTQINESIFHIDSANIILDIEKIKDFK